MATMRENPQTLRIGGSAGFDFMNTTYVLGSRIEILDSPAALLQWMVGAELITQSDVAAIERRLGASGRNRLLADALELRRRLRAMLDVFKEKGPEGIPREDIRYLNAILRKGDTPRQVEVHAKRVSLVSHHAWNTVEEVLALIVASVIETLRTEKFELIKKCAYEPCHLYFVDETKAHRRTYCSQAICGNRVKQAAFRERRRTR